MYAAACMSLSIHDPVKPAALAISWAENYVQILSTHALHPHLHCKDSRKFRKCTREYSRNLYKGFINRCGVPMHKMKTGCVNFRGHAPQISYHSNVPCTSLCNWNVSLWSRLTLIFVESLAKSNPGTLVETMETCIILHVCIDPLPANSPQHLKYFLHKS